MNTSLFIFTGLIVLAGSSLAAIAPILKDKEKPFRIIGVCLTFCGGILGILVGLRSAAKSDTLIRSTAEILQDSGKTLTGVNEALQTSKQVLRETQQNLEESKQSLEIAPRTSENLNEASSYATGGDSYPCVIAYEVTREDGNKQIGFALSKQGKYPLYRLEVFVGKPYKASPSDPTIQTFGARQLFQELNSTGSYPLWFQPVPEEDSTFYSATMSARNGTWEEVINIRKTVSGFASRWVLFVSKDPGISPNKKVLDLADEKFPTRNRRQEIYPISRVTLPVRAGTP